ncbi:molybdenum-dependent oxidoreductase-like protein [Scopulibacillus darangshiensis]|uniref:Molybdenum-dependent oxidoreductase-like protein n=1 Tax=Scopulibacillus darangshiensis TaxID=442528 RepID=A0A4R2P3T6_9BACL|nr:molybdenum-dependent oxidoreductase-like protein [Scopulibacillus darangshiensis]
MKPFLLTRGLVPENQETPIHFLGGDLTPASYFYRRNHFRYPLLTHESYYIPISGCVRTPTIFSFKDILSLPSKTLNVLLECSGEKRAFFHPKVFGEQWEDGALSQARWKGVPLRTLIEYTGATDKAMEVVVEGYDFGTRTDRPGLFSFARSLPIDKALHPDTLIAYELNGKPIPFKHGYPLRLIVPQWYAMASVKWVKKITLINSHFKGPFQDTDYIYYPHRTNDAGRYPVTTMRVNSTIQQPLNLAVLGQGVHKIRGIAWTGQGIVSRVEISVDNGRTWDNATLHTHPKPYVWVSWTYNWDVHEKGEYTVLSRAIDSAGNMQPKQAEWNRKGYGYNAVSDVKVKIE